MKKILITGVTGFVGASLVRYFDDLPDYQIYGYSRDVERARQQFQHSSARITGIFSTEAMDSLSVDSVIHLAGIAHDLSRQYGPADYDRVNFENTQRVFDAFLNSAATTFIFLSSIKAAIDIAHEPATEDITPHPVTDYGKSKLKAEQYIMSAAKSENKRVYILRPCMIHGPGNKGNLNLLYRFVKSGIPYPLGKFENRRSFLSIDNFNFAIRQILEGDIQSGIYHLSDDGYLSTSDLYHVIASALQKKPRILNIPKNLIALGAAMMGRRSMLDKLTEDMLVSNEKFSACLKNEWPVTLTDGITKTIISFRG